MQQNHCQHNDYGGGFQQEWLHPWSEQYNLSQQNITYIQDFSLTEVAARAIIVVSLIPFLNT